MPVSITKSALTEAVVNQMVQRAFGRDASEMEELKEGYFNVAYRIGLGDRQAVLKIAPPREVPVMTYEKNIMFSEVDSMRMIAGRTKVPVPKILFYDDSCEIADREYFFMEMLEGQSLSGLQDRLPESVRQEIYRALGGYNRELNQVQGEKFGYYGQADRQGDDWYEVFRSMILDAYADAMRKQIAIPAARETVLQMLEEDRACFESVKVPRFVHWDIWAGNVFIADDKIEGIIDFERCLWADPLMEAGFRSHQYDKAFYEGYGISELSGEEKRRATWYDVYLALLWCMESDYRMYENRDFYYLGCRVLQERLNVLQHGNT